MSSIQRGTKGDATAILASEGLTWESPAAEVFDSLLYAGWGSIDQVEDAMAWLR